jgi:hypothetical protein
MSAAEGYGTLYLMPVWLGDGGGVEQLPPENIAIWSQRITLYFASTRRRRGTCCAAWYRTIELPIWRSIGWTRTARCRKHRTDDRLVEGRT